MSLEKRLKNIDTFYDDESIMEATYRQLIKDLASLISHEESNKIQSFSMDSIMTFLEPKIHHWILRNKSEIVQFFYRVDLNENLVGNALSSSDLTQGVNKITRAIIRRELVKVITRMYFSEGNSLIE